MPSNLTDATLLVGSVDTSRLEGDRLSVAGKAFRLDGELNVANRGLMEFVEIFTTDSHLLTTLLGLAQEQLIKMDRFGAVYADEVIVGHSNEGDFKTFLTDPSSEALRDRIMRTYVPYNLRVSDELRIYNKLLESGGLESAHLSPLTLPAASTFAILSRLDPPGKPVVTASDKLHAYDGMEVAGFTQDEVAQERRLHPGEGMKGISPRAVMNRLSARAAAPDVECMSPLNALDSIWQARSPGSLAEWRRKRAATRNRLINTYGYCRICAEDLIEYVTFLLRGNSPARIAKNSIEWNWPLNPAEREPAPGF